MNFLKRIANTGTITRVAGLGIGAISAKAVQSEKITGKILSGDKAKFAPAIPILVGLFLSGSRSQLAKNIGAGMISVGAGDAIQPLIPQTIKDQVGINGYDPVMMGKIGTMGAENVLMSGVDDFGGDSMDFTSGASGELNY